jgi:peroxiredoxin
MLAVGDRIPDVTVFGSPGEAISLPKLAAKGPILLFFYLFDWSST